MFLHIGIFECCEKNILESGELAGPVPANDSADFVVVEGEGVVSVGGKEVDTVGPGSYFGEVALISDRVRTATITATTDLRTLVMTFWDFRAFVKGDAEVAWKLLEHVGGLLHGHG